MERTLLASGNKPAIVAVDLGAESCRVSLLREAGGEFCWQVVHRVANCPVASQPGWVWDFNRMLADVVEGLTKCAALAPEGITSIGVDGWAVDYVRLEHDGQPIGNPFCYRDERTVTAMPQLQQRISPQRLYSLTGTHDLRLNTLYQLYADNLAGVSASYRWVNLPEYLLHRLGGRLVSEYTNATHTEMLDVHSRSWSPEVFAALQMPIETAPELVPPGTDVGLISGQLQTLAPFRKTRLIAPACHDTASAVAAIPADGDDWAFISSGTWSLVGTVAERPYTGEDSRKRNFTNHGGVGNTIYLLKNVNGMWMLRQCMDTWQDRGADWKVVELVEASASLPPPITLLDVDDPDLLLPGRMPARINAQMFRKGSKPLDEDPSQAPIFANLIFHSLAARYAEVLQSLAVVTGRQFARIFVVGGGAQNLQMKRLVEAATGMEVVPGSAESSTIGNFAIQLAVLECGSAAGGVDRNTVRRWAEVL